MVSHKRTLILADFDGTLTSKDSLWVFLRYCFRSSSFLQKAMCSIPIWARFKLGLQDNHRSKEQIYSLFFKGMTCSHFERLAVEFSKSQLLGVLLPDAIKELDKHKAEGAEVYIVSASFEDYLIPWCNSKEYSCIATKLEKRNGSVSGKFSSPNCHGEEKVRRIKEVINLKDYTRIIGYGDTEGDRPMLALCHQSFFRKF